MKRPPRCVVAAPSASNATRRPKRATPFASDGAPTGGARSAPPHRWTRTSFRASRQRGPDPHQTQIRPARTDVLAGRTCVESGIGLVRPRRWVPAGEAPDQAIVGALIRVALECQLKYRVPVTLGRGLVDPYDVGVRGAPQDHLLGQVVESDLNTSHASSLGLACRVRVASPGVVPA